ncbi:MAG: TrkH family potassium uptake protein, partial [Candidatus Bipolaricaulota bacterium]|nr:TrkH family potassium uptake protein [Candidatus Bipolaricaulota bacterium]
FVIDGELIRPEEVQRTTAIFFAWVGLLALGSLLTGFLTGFSPLESFSGIASALGNVGPTYIDPRAFIAISPAVKVFYIIMMVGGRLEILPLLLIFSRRVWR